jgi:hypothetical protein
LQKQQKISTIELYLNTITYINPIINLLSDLLITPPLSMAWLVC